MKVAQSCLTLCYPVGHRVHGILSARILDSVAFPFSRGSSLPRNWTPISCIARRFFNNWAIRETLSSVQSLSRVRLFVTPWFEAGQASLSITSSQRLPKLTSIESVMPSSNLTLYPQSLPAAGSFPVSQLFAWGGQTIGVSASASVLPMNTQDWSPLGWTGWISSQSKGLSSVKGNPNAILNIFKTLHPCSNISHIEI